jgi:hypothetical protein
MINDRPTYSDLMPETHGKLMNVRMVNAIFDDENPLTRPQGFHPDLNTGRFIESMDQFKSKGILAFTLNLQGGMPGYEGAVNSAFCSDGTLKPEYLDRASRVIEAADARGMVIILGFFYQRQDQILESEEAIIEAVRNASSWLNLKGYTNVLVEIANEYRHPGFDHQIILEEEGEIRLMETVRENGPDLMVSTSGMGDALFHNSLADAADFILLHGNVSEPEDYAGRVAAVEGSGKPIVFNEDWCFSDDTRGVFDAVIKMKAAFHNGASWGVMNQQRNQTYPFEFSIGRPEEGPNATEDFQLYQSMAEMMGLD